MSDKDVILADSISHLPHLAAFDLMVKKRFSELQMDSILMYLIDSVDASALPWLADQFDVLGFKGYGLATTDAERREVIKKAIELHRYKGTIWAIEEALKGIGYPDSVIMEHVAGHWAKFRVTIDLGDKPASEQVIADLVRIIKEYKNTRSVLTDISFTLALGEDIVLTDSSDENSAVIEDDSINVGGNFKYDGSQSYNGGKNYSQDQDVLTITIV